MNLDQMMDAWRAQEHKPLYGVNRDLLQLVLQHEQAKVRRSLRLANWTAAIIGVGMALWAAFWLWVLTFKQEPLRFTVIGTMCVGVLTLWVGALWASRRHQVQRERGFGNTLQEEVKRSLSLVEYQLSKVGSWSTALLWSLPPSIGAVLLCWLVFGINHERRPWFYAEVVVLGLVSTFISTYEGSRAARQKLELSRERLRQLLDSLNISE